MERACVARQDCEGGVRRTVERFAVHRLTYGAGRVLLWVWDWSAPAAVIWVAALAAFGDESWLRLAVAATWLSVGLKSMWPRRRDR